MQYLPAVISRCSICWIAAIAVLAAVILPSGRVAAAQAVTIGPTLDAVVGDYVQGYSGDGGPAANAELNGPDFIAFDRAGNLYVSDESNSVIRKVSTAGVITTIAGNGKQGFSGDGGPATSAELDIQGGIALDNAGNLYIADFYNARVRKVAAGTGIITTVAGNGTPGFSGDGGPAAQAELYDPEGVAVDSAGNLYIVDTENKRIRKVSATTGVITTVAGNGTRGDTGDGEPATDAAIAPESMIVDSAGDLYIANYDPLSDEDTQADAVRKVSATTGIITTVAGNGTPGFRGDGGPATSAELHLPGGIALDNAGNLYIADIYNNRVREVSALTGIITTVVGNGPYGDSSSCSFSTGTATGSELCGPTDVAFDSAGHLFIADGVNDVIREMGPPPATLIFPAVPVGTTSTPVVIPLDINTDGTVITNISAPVSQGGKQEYEVTGTGGCALNTALPIDTVCDVSVTFSPAYVGERPAPLQVASSAGTFNFGVMGTGTGPEVALTPGIVTTVAGNGQKGLSGNGGPAIAAELSAPADLALDSAGNLYISDNGNDQVRMVSATTGVITNVAGSDTPGSPILSSPDEIALDAAGNLYIADQLNNMIRERSADTGAFTIVAGNGTPGFSGDGGPATAGELNNPTGIAVDAEGNLYIADEDNARIRRVAASTGFITTIAGTGVSGDNGDGGLAIDAELYAPLSVSLDSVGDVYFTESNITNGPASDVRKIVAGTGIITTVAGTGATGYSGDGGPATSAELNGPSDIALDSAGDIYIADFGNGAIREVDAATGMIQTIAGTGTLGSTGDGGPATKAEIVSLALALDGAGNVYFSNSLQETPSYNTVRKIDVSSGLLDFAGTPVGTTSADSPQTATVSNIGNMPLDFTPSGTNPSLSSNNFTLSNSGSCPQLDASSTTATLASGNDCTLFFSFTPTTSGAISGTATIANNALNFPAATQIIHLNGAAIGGGGGGTVGDFTLTATPSNQTIFSGSTATYRLSVAGTGGFTGAVTLTETGLPPGASTNLNPTGVTISGSTPATATLKIETAADQARLMLSSHPGNKGSPIRFGLLLLPLSLLGIAGLRKRLQVLPRTALLLVFILLSLAATTGLTGCANIGPVLNAQAYTITITGTSGGLQHSQTVTLNVDEYTIVKNGH